jgi:Flp pilus assembly protein protease CpaA
LWLLISVTIAGGVLAMLIIGVRMADWSEAMQRRAIILRPKSGIPYGIAIAAGALLMVTSIGSQQPVDPRTNWKAVTGLALR